MNGKKEEIEISIEINRFVKKCMELDQISVIDASQNHKIDMLYFIEDLLSSDIDIFRINNMENDEYGSDNEATESSSTENDQETRNNDEVINTKHNNDKEDNANPNDCGNIEDIESIIENMNINGNPNSIEHNEHNENQHANNPNNSNNDNNGNQSDSNTSETASARSCIDDSIMAALDICICKITNLFVNEHRYRKILQKLYNSTISKDEEAIKEYITQIFQIVTEKRLFHDPIYGIHENKENIPKNKTFDPESGEMADVFTYIIILENRNGSDKCNINEILEKRLFFLKNDVYYNILRSKRDCEALRIVCDVLNVQAPYTLEEIYTQSVRKKFQIELKIMTFYTYFKKIRESKKLIDLYNREIYRAKVYIKTVLSIEVLEILQSMEKHKEIIDKERETYSYMVKTIDYLIEENALNAVTTENTYAFELVLSPVSIAAFFTECTAQLHDLTTAKLQNTNEAIENTKKLIEYTTREIDILQAIINSTLNKLNKTKKESENELRQTVLLNNLNSYHISLRILKEEKEKESKIKRISLYAKHVIERNIKQLSIQQIEYIINSIEDHYDGLVNGIKIRRSLPSEETAPPPSTADEQIAQEPITETDINIETNSQHIAIDILELEDIPCCSYNEDPNPEIPDNTINYCTVSEIEQPTEIKALDVISAEHTQIETIGLLKSINSMRIDKTKQITNQKNNKLPENPVNYKYKPLNKESHTQDKYNNHKPIRKHLANTMKVFSSVVIIGGVFYFIYVISKSYGLYFLSLQKYTS